jgi:hypothetical protein
MDPHDCRGAGTPTVKQKRVDQQRIVPAGAVSTLGLCGRHNPAQDEPHFGNGRSRRGGRPCVPGRPTVPPPGRTTTGNDTQHESNEDDAATPPCRREPVEQWRSSGATPQDLSLRRRELIRGIHPIDDTRRASLEAGAECGSARSNGHCVTTPLSSDKSGVCPAATNGEDPAILHADGSAASTTTRALPVRPRLTRSRHRRA